MRRKNWGTIRVFVTVVGAISLAILCFFIFVGSTANKVSADEAKPAPPSITQQMEDVIKELNKCADSLANTGSSWYCCQWGCGSERMGDDFKFIDKCLQDQAARLHLLANQLRIRVDAGSINSTELLDDKNTVLEVEAQIWTAGNFATMTFNGGKTSPPPAKEIREVESKLPPIAHKLFDFAVQANPWLTLPPIEKTSPGPSPNDAEKGTATPSPDPAAAKDKTQGKGKTAAPTPKSPAGNGKIIRSKDKGHFTAVAPASAKPDRPTVTKPSPRPDTEKGKPHPEGAKSPLTKSSPGSSPPAHGSPSPVSKKSTSEAKPSLKQADATPSPKPTETTSAPHRLEDDNY